jgi:hypothetical protein
MIQHLSETAVARFKEASSKEKVDLTECSLARFRWNDKTTFVVSGSFCATGVFVPAIVLTKFCRTDKAFSAFPIESLQR